MNTIARASAALFVVAILGGSAAAQELPQGGDCRFFAAQGLDYWQGRFGGAWVDLFDRRRLLFRRACFTSREACTRWLNEMMSAADDTDYMRCDPKP